MCSEEKHTHTYIHTNIHMYTQRTMGKVLKIRHGVNIHAHIHAYIHAENHGKGVWTYRATTKVVKVHTSNKYKTPEKGKTS